MDSYVLRMYIWNYIMWLEEACCGSSDLQGKGAVIIEFILNIFRDYPVKRSHFSHDAYILDTSSGNQAFRRDFQNRSVGIVQHQARRSGINPDYANPKLMHEARRE